MKPLSRREAAGAAALSALSYSRVLGANRRIGLGLIGAGNRGQYVTKLFQANPEVEVRGICDVYAARIDQALAISPGARTTREHEELLSWTNVDAVLIGSPDHWHAAHAVDAMNAGKDVYVEKPLCRTRDEAPKMVKAARANNRVCQVGLQQRSGQVYLDALEQYVSSGKLGKVGHIDAVWHGRIPRPFEKELVEKPTNLDWIRFLGPVPYRDWAPNEYLHFRSFLDYNGGKTTDFGHHWMDVVHMFMGERAPRSAVFAGGIHYQFNDGRTAPDTCNALFEYEGFTVLFQSNAYSVPEPEGVTFHGSQGKLFVNRRRWEFTPAGLKTTVETKEYPGDITQANVRNFLDCCASRKRPNADVALAAVSIQPPLLAVQSYLEQRRLRFDPNRLAVLPE